MADFTWTRFIWNIDPDLFEPPVTNDDLRPDHGGLYVHAVDGDGRPYMVPDYVAKCR